MIAIMKARDILMKIMKDNNDKQRGKRRNKQVKTQSNKEDKEILT